MYKSAAFFVEIAISTTWDKLWDAKYIIIETNTVKMFDIIVEKKNTRAKSISNFKNVNTKLIIIKWSISIHFMSITAKSKRDWKNTIIAIVAENPKNFQRINSYLPIGFDRIRKIVFPSTSLNKSWLQTNKTPINQNISIIDNPKSTIILLSSQSVNCPKTREKIINKNPKNKIIYKNLFLTISLKVLNAIFNIV